MEEQNEKENSWISEVWWNFNITKCEFLSSSFIGELYEKKLCKGGLMNDLVTKFIEKSAYEFLAPYFKVYLLQFLN